MTWTCLFGLHRPSTVSIARAASGFRALCESCGAALERSQEGRWSPAPPLAARPLHGRRSA